MPVMAIRGQALFMLSTTYRKEVEQLSKVTSLKEAISTYKITKVPFYVSTLELAGLSYYRKPRLLCTSAYCALTKIPSLHGKN